MALTHTILVMISQVLTKREPHRERGANYFDEREHVQVERRLVRRLERLGYDVTLQLVSPPQIAVA